MVWPWKRRRADRAGNGRRSLSRRGSPVHEPADPNPLTDPQFISGLRPVPTGGVGGAIGWPAAPIVGQDPNGNPLTIAVDETDDCPLLLAFLSVDCLGCQEFWSGLADHPDDSGLCEPGLSSVRTVAVTKGPGHVAPGDVAAVSTEMNSVPVVMSDGAWSDYRVTGYPFFVVVDPTARTVLAETVGMSWSDVHAILPTATPDDEYAT